MTLVGIEKEFRNAVLYRNINKTKELLKSGEVNINHKCILIPKSFLLLKCKYFMRYQFEMIHGIEFVHLIVHL